jgi:hypothetical protein
MELIISIKAFEIKSNLMLLIICSASAVKREIWKFVPAAPPSKIKYPRLSPTMKYNAVMFLL